MFVAFLGELGFAFSTLHDRVLWDAFSFAVTATSTNCEPFALPRIWVLYVRGRRCRIFICRLVVATDVCLVLLWFDSAPCACGAVLVPTNDKNMKHNIFATGFYGIWLDLSWCIHPKHSKNGSWTCKRVMLKWLAFVWDCTQLFEWYHTSWESHPQPVSTNDRRYWHVFALTGFCFCSSDWIFKKAPNPVQSCSWESWDVFLELRRVGSWGSWQILWSWSVGLQCAAQQFWLSGIQKSSKFIKIHFRKVSCLVYNVVRVISWPVNPLYNYSCKLWVSWTVKLAGSSSVEAKWIRIWDIPSSQVWVNSDKMWRIWMIRW